MKTNHCLFYKPEFFIGIGFKFFIFTLVILINCSATASSSYAFSLKTEHIKVAGNLYEKPATNALVIAELQGGDVVTLIHQDYDWYVVKLPDNRTGWIHESLFMKKISTLKSEKGVPAEAETVSSQEMLSVKVHTGRVREIPSLESEIKFRLEKGDTVSLLETKGNWHFIKHGDGLTGWAHKNLFHAQVPTQNAEAYSEIKEIQVDITPEGDEKVIFVLNGFHPPETFVLEENIPKVVCDFFGSRLASDVDHNKEVNGSFVQKIRIGDHKGAKPKLRVVLDLVPDQNYEVEQVFFRKENLYTLTFKPASE